VLRGEAVWSPDMPYSNLAGPVPIRASTTCWLLGADYQWRDRLLSGQVSDRVIPAWRAEMGVPERAAVVTVSATGISHQGRMAHRFAWTVMPQQGDGQWLQWRSSWQFDDRWQIEATIDLLDGHHAGFFGQFRQRDRG